MDTGVHLALKMLDKDLARDVVFLRRFKREAQNLASLAAPQYCPILWIRAGRYTGFYADGLYRR